MCIRTAVTTSCGSPIRLGTSSSRDRKSTRLNSSHGYISYAVFCLKKKKKHHDSIDHARHQRLTPHRLAAIQPPPQPPPIITTLTVRGTALPHHRSPSTPDNAHPS